MKSPAPRTNAPPSKQSSVLRPSRAVLLKWYSPTLSTIFLVLALSGCGGGESSSGASSGGSSSGGSSSAGGSSCNYTDLVTTKERTESNACGIQVSGAYGAADARLQQIIQACQLGQKAAANADYDGPYTKLVQFARDNSKALSCGSSNNGPVLPNPSTQTYFNFCTKTSGNTKTGSCWGPVFKDDGGCSDGTFTYVSQSSNSSACLAARDNFLK